MSGLLSIIENSGDTFINDDTYKRFFKNPEFHQCLQQYLLNKYSIEVKITSEERPKKYRSNTKKNTQQIRIAIKNETDSNKQRILFDFITNYFKKVYTKTENDSSNISYFRWIQKDTESLNLLHRLINKKIDNLFTLVAVTSDGTFSVNALPKNPTDEINIEKLENFLCHDVVKEVISLPLPHERSIQMKTELNALLAEHNADHEILVKKIYTGKQKEFVIFGLEKNVQKLKRDLQQIIERNILHTYKLNPMDRRLINDILSDYHDKIKEFEENYKNFGVTIRLNLHEFSAPQHLKDETELFFQRLLSQSASTNTTTFESQSLYRKIAEQEGKYLKSIIQNSRCYTNIEFQHTSTVHSVPKSTTTDNQISKSIVTQSELFLSSAEIFKKMIIQNGSIELRIGDVTLQQVEVLIIPRMFNGLKDGIIERAGTFDYEKTEVQSDGTMYTETDGGKLSCKRILFSNWTPNCLINNENILKSSIRSFMTKSIEHMNNASSIAFAVPDSCTDEIILAREMFLQAKQRLENETSELRIVLVLLPEQKSLHKIFSDLIENTENVHAYFDWPMTVIKITLMSADIYQIDHCEQRLKKYLSRSISSIKVSNSNGIFQFWDQHLINSFYKYCKDRCVLPKLDETQTELEFIGSTTAVEEVKKKFEILSKLVKEKFKYSSVIKRPSSARAETNQSINLYNIVLSYHRRDIRKCQRLINQLTDEGFSIGIDEEKRDIRSQMMKSDCIILCISENYYENCACIEEAKYAFETNKKVFLVTFQNISSLGWNNDLFEGELFFQLFGSQYHFDLEYERLLIELLQYTKPGFNTVLQRKASFIQENNVSHAILSHNTTISTIPSRQLTSNEERWLYKVENIPRLKLTLYSARSSFINDKPVTAELHSFDDKRLDMDIPRSELLNGSHLSLIRQSIRQTFAENERIYGINYEKSPKIFPTDQSSDEFIPRRANMDYYCPYYLSRGQDDPELIKELEKFDNVETRKYRREKLAKYFIEKYKHYTEEQLGEYLKFAQTMKDNIEAFETFCKTSESRN